MTEETFARIEAHMLARMNDGAHDAQHVYRVLYAALDLASGLKLDMDALIAAALLHDIGREAQFKDPALDHAAVGADLAVNYLRGLGWPEGRVSLAAACIRTHRYRKNAEPESPEAKILFDADKLDVAGAIGIARTLAYKGIVAEPFYSLDEAGRVLNGDGDAAASFFQEYRWKLEKVYEGFYTEKARATAAGRRAAAASFYESMLDEVRCAHRDGRARLEAVLD